MSDWTIAMNEESDLAPTEGAGRDGLAALAILVITVLLIVFVVSAIV